MSSVQDVDFGIRNVLPVTLGLAGIEGKIALPPKDQ